MPAQFFKISDEGDLILHRFILEKISFHMAVFPFLHLIGGGTH
jgi:hypothetical protein